MKTPCSAQAGMTLLELMIALTIFVVVAFALVVAFNEALEVAAERNELEQAVIGLHNQLALLHGSRLQVQELDLPEDSAGIHYHLRVSQQTLQTQDKKDLIGFYQVELEAKWKIENREESRSVTELFYQP